MPRDPRATALVAVAAAVLLSTGCPPSDKKAPPSSSSASSSPCTKVGQTCEVDAGKLGTCVQKDDCAPGATCFVCQSQH
jgi:hypothetical protein